MEILLPFLAKAVVSILKELLLEAEPEKQDAILSEIYDLLNKGIDLVGKKIEEIKIGE